MDATEEQPVGYLVALNNRILQCYADNAEIAQLVY